MKRFTFRFEKLQKIREQDEEASLLRLSLAQTDLAREEKMMADLLSDVQATSSKLLHLLQSGQPLTLIRNADSFRSGRTAQAENQKQKIRDAKQKVVKAQEDYRQARMRAESIRKLREKRLQVHKKSELRELNKEMDEFGSRKTTFCR